MAVTQEFLERRKRCMVKSKQFWITNEDIKRVVVDPKTIVIYNNEDNQPLTLEDIFEGIPSNNRLYGVIASDVRTTDMDVNKVGDELKCTPKIINYNEPINNLDVVKDRCYIHRPNKPKACGMDFYSIGVIYEGFPGLVSIPLNILLHREESKLFKPKPYNAKEDNTSKLKTIYNLHKCDMKGLDFDIFKEFMEALSNRYLKLKNSEGLVGLTVGIEKKYNIPRKIFGNICWEWYLLSHKRYKLMPDHLLETGIFNLTENFVPAICTILSHGDLVDYHTDVAVSRSKKWDG